jgi:ADP-ribosylglycohydrolase
VAVLADGDPMRAIYAGINIGGDTDTIASLAGGICGAMRGPREIDARQLAIVELVNHLDLAGIARDLVGGEA